MFADQMNYKKNLVFHDVFAVNEGKNNWWDLFANYGTLIVFYFYLKQKLY